MYLDSGLQVVKKEAQNLQIGLAQSLWANSHFCQKRHQTYFAKQALQNDNLGVDWILVLWAYYFLQTLQGAYTTPLFGRSLLGFFVTGGFLFTSGNMCQAGIAPITL